MTLLRRCAPRSGPRYPVPWPAAPLGEWGVQLIVVARAAVCRGGGGCALSGSGPPGATARRLGRCLRQRAASPHRRPGPCVGGGMVEGLAARSLAVVRAGVPPHAALSPSTAPATSAPLPRRPPPPPPPPARAQASQGRAWAGRGLTAAARSTSTRGREGSTAEGGGLCAGR